MVATAPAQPSAATQPSAAARGNAVGPGLASPREGDAAFLLRAADLRGPDPQRGEARVDHPAALDRAVRSTRGDRPRASFRAARAKPDSLVRGGRHGHGAAER